ncbi:hypothetical protein LNV09_13110 [Paucibacter sp. B2R-40]|uniref:hypothetical protein n=1 Tax=Paucibacter sp. B2R-40 TaxID=2893554 RepID=UPI0021E49A35|nr:hypothetical protein [Paucibacter sp. B2R-40]MCV2355092.1 hypothetical protein [Paucibacter sp. B2R-40]
MTRASSGYLDQRSVAARWGWLLVLLLHLLMWALLREVRRSEPSAPEPKVSSGWLIPIPLLLAKKQAAEDVEPPLLRLKPSLAPRLTAQQRTDNLAARPVPSPGISISNSGAETAALNPAKELKPSPLAPSPERLKLGLPARPASAAQSTPAQMAAQDPRGNSHRPDMGERMAAALGSDPSLREEIINPGHRRFRQGSSCIDVQDTRNSQLNPFDESARMGAKLMSKCKD